MRFKTISKKMSIDMKEDKAVFPNNCSCFKNVSNSSNSSGEVPCKGGFNPDNAT